MRVLAPALLCLLLVSPALAARRCGDDVDGRTIPCDCGDVLVGSRTLGDDDPITSRVCPGDGLLVRIPRGAEGVLALSGHVIAGSSHGVGIQVLQGGEHGFTITGPGIVSGFDTGVQATTGAIARIADISSSGNRLDGFSIVSVGSVVTGCEASGNGRDGFALRGSEYRLTGNHASGNGRDGLRLAGRSGTIGDGVGNEAAGNRRDGVHLRGRGHDLERPVATANGARGIRANGTESRIAGATASGNRGAGVRATGGDLTVSDSDARGNGGRGIDVRGARVRDGGGNRGGGCRVGAACR